MGRLSEKTMERRWRALRKRQMENIAEYGRTVIAVFADEDSTDPINDTFSYTIGNALNGDMPELLAIGINDSVTLNLVSKKMIELGRAFKDGELVDLGGKVPVAIVHATDEVKDVYTIQATSILGGRDKYTVHQVVLPDKNGKFPWDDGVLVPFGLIKIWRRIIN